MKYNVYDPAQFGSGGEVSVHDPSVFYDERTGKYYVFGTHFAVACSDDLIHWTQLTTAENGAKLLYGRADFRSVLTEADKIVPYTAKGGIRSTWAPHVEKIGRKYYMYYSLTSAFGSSKSVIGRVSADDVLGPYSHDEVIVWSTGRNSPNCIDPQIFRDGDSLWLIYGSFFNGIYIKELDPATGLPLQNGGNDYGSLLWKGGKRGVEGPFVFYNETTGYYYLMVSDGSLSSDYNMRAARAKNVKGPYYDITGANMASAYGGGNKLAGNFQFAGGAGHAALGHNSVLKKKGAYFVLCHARSRSGSGNSVSHGHHLEVRQLYFNQDGWPLLSPNRYAGEKLRKVTAEEIAGSYDFILHSLGNSARFVPSFRCSLQTDGTAVTEQSEGRWALSDDYYILVTLDGVEYRGVAAPCKDSRSQGGVCITAASQEGRSLWAKPSEI